MCCGNSILLKGLPFFYLHKIFYTLGLKERGLSGVKMVISDAHIGLTKAVKEYLLCAS
ncbi:TPA: transposase [Enterococcus faecium]|nr:transposase [Enterococcus faecium]EKQ3704359.1 transposase [Enterococcus faecium]EKY7920705.1 transposase [Enterococcus faecium]EKY7946803.1 transposase [Enterococcus faecium]EKZ0061877.1 transposase [Enterococcus faecium]